MREAVELTQEPDHASETPLAHSAPSAGVAADLYVRHILGVREGARERIEAMIRHAVNPPAGFAEAVEEAATFHDLGKLDRDNQRALRRGRQGKLKWDHIDGGVAHLSKQQDWMAAWLVRAHHAPGLPEKQEHFNRDNLGRRLRGRRHDDDTEERQNEQIARTDAHLGEYLDLHEQSVGPFQISARRPIHGLTMRLALSCLVDADHSDTAFYDTGLLSAPPPDPRWADRLNSLRRYVAALPKGGKEAELARNRRREEFFKACLNSPVEASIVACEGPVGIGKTTAVAGYLIQRALRQKPQLRRLIVIAPYTNILSQTAETLRSALVLPGEDPAQVVVEHHHRADFDCREDRDLAVLWRAPIILTTAVSFFETLASAEPAELRKLHEVPGSAIFIDEAHAALPTKLWAQNWQWLKDLADHWSCQIVLASGSLVRFWENADIIGSSLKLPELLTPVQAADVLGAERSRVRYSSLGTGRVVGIDELIDEIDRSPGPRLLILNTVQTAAIVARSMRAAGRDVLHLSTALTPIDRDRILGNVKARLKNATDREWTLVATSCVEAGVDLSFRSAFRERFSAASTIQVGGRVNRHGEFDAEGGAGVYDFALFDEGVTQHPAAAVSADVLREMMSADKLNLFSPADAVSEAMQQEIARIGGLGVDPLLKAEKARDYPGVRDHGRVITADTRIVVVDPMLKASLIAPRSERLQVRFRDLLSGSVQMWARRIELLRLTKIPHRRELYSWEYGYEREFIGYMAGVLENLDFLKNGGAVI